MILTGTLHDVCEVFFKEEFTVVSSPAPQSCLPSTTTAKEAYTSSG